MYVATKTWPRSFIYGLAFILGACQFYDPRGSTSSVVALIEKLNKGDCVAKINALDDLKRHGANAKPAIPTLIRILENEEGTIPGASTAVSMKYIARPEDAKPTIRAHSAITLGAIGPEAKSAIPTLIRNLRDRHSLVRFASARALAGIGLKEHTITAALSESLVDQAISVRIEAALALAALDPENQDAVQTLIKLANDQNAGTRRMGTLSLGAIKSTRIKVAIPVLLDALRDSDEGVRGDAAQSLGSICEEASTVVPALVDRLNDESADVRVSSAQSLGAFGPQAKAAIPALTRALKDPDNDVRIRAVQSLKRIRSEKGVRNRF